MAYWLFKSEPDCFSFDDLWAAPARSTGWDGVRNFQARNFLRDQIQVGDGVLFYHSGGNPPAIAGLAEVVAAGHPDPTALDPDSDKHDPKSRPDAPIWYQVTIRAVRPVAPPLDLAEPPPRRSPGRDGVAPERVAPEHPAGFEWRVAGDFGVD